MSKGNYKVTTKYIDLKPNQLNLFDFSFPYDISLINILFDFKEPNRNDVFDILIDPGKVSGKLTQTLKKKYKCTNY